MLARTVAVVVMTIGSVFGSFAAGARSPVRPAADPAASLIASGLTTPTSFAFGAGRTFVADGGTEDGKHHGGVFVLSGARATRLAGSPTIALGLAWSHGTLYVSALSRLLAWSGWNGSAFVHRRVIYSGPRGFTGFNGLGFGPNGRLYAGVFLGSVNDHSATRTPYAFDLLSLNAAGKDLQIVARGLRQPFQIAFTRGSSSPLVSVLAQDLPTGIKPPDFLARIHRGDDYGFPRCNWLGSAPCHGYTRPFKFLRPHASPMGLAVIGTRLYVALFNGLDPEVGAAVASMPVAGGALTPALSGFAAPIVALGQHNGSLYVGDVRGHVFRFRP